MDDPADVIQVMVAVPMPPSQPHFKCVLVDKNKSLLAVFKELELEGDDQTRSADPSAKVSTSESGTFFPFNDRVSLNQACVLPW